MIKMRGKILIVDDNEDVLLSLNMLLKQHVEAVRVITRPERIGEFMDSFGPDVILLDMNFTRNANSGEEGYKWLEFILKKDPRAVVLFITAYVDIGKAVRAIKAGAVDFIPKPWDNDKLLGIVDSAIQLSLSRHGVAVDDKDATMPVLIGESPQMQTLKTQIRRVGTTDANVLITGENGSGKDVVAHLLHHYSPRKSKPFVSIDLGAVPENLFESELFGYEKGAFTDARVAKAGKLELSTGGTAFLDEIGNLSIGAQQKLLTLIEKRELSRLGSNSVKRIDTRIIAATNADLAQMVAEGTFRQDLFYRINTIELPIPPLRERGNDIVLLAEHFASALSARYKIAPVVIADSAKAKLLSHSWPGNVRELQHVIERAIVFSNSSEIGAADIEFARSVPTVSFKERKESLNLESMEQSAIMKAIELSNGNLSQAASMLGISRFALYRKIEKFGL